MISTLGGDGKPAPMLDDPTIPLREENARLLAKVAKWERDAGKLRELRETANHDFYLAVQKAEEFKAQVEGLEGMLVAVLRRMQAWGADEDGIPLEAWADYERAAIAVRLRAPRCHQGVQECHTIGACFDFSCCDHPEHKS